MTVEALTALCLLATAPLADRVAADRYATCYEVATQAAVAGHDPVLLVSLASEESNFRADAASSRGALGPLQARPAHWCPDGRAKGCDLVAAGLRAVEAWQARKGSRWLCHYNAGNDCGLRAHRYARRIERRAASWRARLERAGVLEAVDLGDGSER